MKSKVEFTFDEQPVDQPSDTNIKFTLIKHSQQYGSEKYLKLSLHDSKNNINSDKIFKIDSQTAITDSGYHVLPIVFIFASLFSYLICLALSVRITDPIVVVAPLWIIPPIVLSLSILSLVWMFRQCNLGGYFCIERRLKRLKKTMLRENYDKIDENIRIEKLQVSIDNLIEQHEES